jgi:hypothetical protein
MFVGEICFHIYVVVSVLAKVTLATKHSFEWDGCDLFENIATSPPEQK